MKLVKKSKLKFKNNMFFHKNKAVDIDPEVTRQLNKLEETIQMYDYLNAQPKESAPRSLAGFKRKSSNEGRGIDVSVHTPELDARKASALKIKDELEKLDSANQAQKLLDEIVDLIEWLQSDEVLISPAGQYVTKHDYRMLGNPLELMPDEVLHIVDHMATDPDINIGTFAMDELIMRMAQFKIGPIGPCSSCDCDGDFEGC